MLGKTPTEYLGNMEQVDGEFCGAVRRVHRSRQRGVQRLVGEGKRHGEGTLTLTPRTATSTPTRASGSTTCATARRFHDRKCTYKGQFKEGKKHGKGKIEYTESNGIYPERLSYDGEWENDMYEGKGKMTCRAGGSHDGLWSKHKAHGLGTRTYKNGDVWVGNVDQGQKSDPNALLRRPNGDTLVGPWVKSQRHGTFTETSAADGCVTKIVYKSGMRVRMSKKRALRNAMEELDEHQEHAAHGVRALAKRLKVVYEQLNTRPRRWPRTGMMSRVVLGRGKREQRRQPRTDCAQRDYSHFAWCP